VGLFSFGTVFEKTCTYPAAHINAIFLSSLATLERHRNACMMDYYVYLDVNDCQQSSDRCWQEPTFDSKAESRP
jgi:hypothetical protein